MRRKDIIYLIGFMGSGKTTAGRRIASSLGWSFVDLDQKITEKAGMTIPGIFSTKGEEFFRLLEEEELKATALLKNVVVSTGGGAPCHADNMEFMNNNGVTIYLHLSPEALASRLRRSPGDRPLIKNIPEPDLPEYIRTTLRKRDLFYKKAAIIADGISLEVSTLIKAVNDL